jgi:hypothetical protein
MRTHAKMFLVLSYVPLNFMFHYVIELPKSGLPKSENDSMNCVPNLSQHLVVNICLSFKKYTLFNK